ncbi:hypothetical protein MUK42_12395 [Musa troglodytarum]|uniref:BTB domain-containing protein n=1 Tax=Musa troglodytarum TaxID=320322 RepID=A0A9E7GZM8_9LILI|nr:hypothetical protein MUK42_12395 [Musa troglodytarum]
MVCGTWCLPRRDRGYLLTNRCTCLAFLIQSIERDTAAFPYHRCKAPFLLRLVYFPASESESESESAMSAGVGNPSDSKVETIARLAQWRIESFGPCSYRRSDAFSIGIWNWYLSVEKNRYMHIRLFPEPCRVSKEQLPVARFVVRVFSPCPGRRPYVSPVHRCEDLDSKRRYLTDHGSTAVYEKLLRTSEDFVWVTDFNCPGRFIVDVEFLDLKIAPLNGGDLCSIWSNGRTLQSLSSKNTFRCLSRMLEEGIHADVTIKTSNGLLKAHKAVLAASSPVFKSMFVHNLREKESSTIVVEDMSLEACLALLNYMYGTIERDQFWKHRLALLGAADKYDIGGLKDCCEDSLSEDINSDNVLERLHEAWLYQLNKLKKGCMTYLFDFGKIHDVKDELNAFFRHADRKLMLEMFQEALTAWNLSIADPRKTSSDHRKYGTQPFVSFLSSAFTTSPPPTKLGFRKSAAKMSTFSGDETAPFFGFLGAAAALVFSCMGAAYGTAKSGVGVASMGVMRPELVMKSIVPVVMAGVLGIYGLIIAVIISTGINPKAKSYYLFDGYAHLSSGLACGLAGLSAGMAIGIVGDAGVRRDELLKLIADAAHSDMSLFDAINPRANAQQPKLFVGIKLRPNQTAVRASDTPFTTAPPLLAVTIPRCGSRDGIGLSSYERSVAPSFAPLPSPPRFAASSPYLWVFLQQMRRIGIVQTTPTCSLQSSSDYSFGVSSGSPSSLVLALFLSSLAVEISLGSFSIQSSSECRGFFRFVLESFGSSSPRLVYDSFWSKLPVLGISLVFYFDLFRFVLWGMFRYPLPGSCPDLIRLKAGWRMSYNKHPGDGWSHHKQQQQPVVARSRISHHRNRARHPRLEDVVEDPAMAGLLGGDRRHPSAS